jgi:hypothetical protein
VRSLPNRREKEKRCLEMVLTEDGERRRGFEEFRQGRQCSCAAERTNGKGEWIGGSGGVLQGGNDRTREGEGWSAW